MKIKKGFVLRDVCGEQVIMGEGLDAINFGKLLVLNETAAWLWKRAQQMVSFNIESLTEELCGEYDVPVDEARKDVAEMLQKWQDAGLIEILER